MRLKGGGQAISIYNIIPIEYWVVVGSGVTSKPPSHLNLAVVLKKEYHISMNEKK